MQSFVICLLLRIIAYRSECLTFLSAAPVFDEGEKKTGSTWKLETDLFQFNR